MLTHATPDLGFKLRSRHLHLLSVADWPLHQNRRCSSVIFESALIPPTQSQLFANGSGESVYTTDSCTEMTRDPVAVDHFLPRFNVDVNQCKTSDGNWTRKPLAYRESKNFSSMCNPSFRHICLTIIFKLLSFT